MRLRSVSCQMLGCRDEFARVRFFIADLVGLPYTETLPTIPRDGLIEVCKAWFLARIQPFLQSFSVACPISSQNPSVLHRQQRLGRSPELLPVPLPLPQPM